jgi:predicted dehydrogenase
MLRIGLLGAAKIAPAALINPAKACPEASIVAVAARDTARAQAFAAKHSIPRTFSSYAALLDDPGIDAVYIPLPNGLHGEWAIAAMKAGKQVLCEKPVAANADEARAMASAKDETGRVLMEAFHYRYHPLAQRMADIAASGELGTIEHIYSTMWFPLPVFSDIRYRFDLAGGATMDAGCYAVHMARLVGGPDPAVLSAKAKLRDLNVDRAMDAELRFKSGAAGHISVSMWSRNLLGISLRVVGSAGEMRAINPVAPQLWHRLTIRTKSGKRTENLGSRPTYLYQLEAFLDACLRGAPVLTSIEDGILNMQVIDDIYRAAGLPVRRPTSTFRAAL